MLLATHRCAPSAPSSLIRVSMARPAACHALTATGAHWDAPSHCQQRVILARMRTAAPSPRRQTAPHVNLATNAREATRPPPNANPVTTPPRRANTSARRAQAASSNPTQPKRHVMLAVRGPTARMAPRFPYLAQQGRHRMRPASHLRTIAPWCRLASILPLAAQRHNNAAGRRCTAQGVGAHRSA